MPSSLIIGALGLEAGGLAAGLVTLGVRLAETYAISSLINKDQGTSPTSSSNPQGGNVNVPPATNNKLGVVYGNQFVSPIIVDAALSNDQQTMWYVLAFSETTDTGTITFGDVYWDDKLLVFDPANPSEISCWYIPATSGGSESNSRVTGVAGKISMWFYNNGSNSEAPHRCIDTFGDQSITFHTSGIDAITLMGPTGPFADQLDPALQWTANNLMSNTVFAIVKVQYDQNHSIQNIGNIKAEIKNTLTSPGSVIKDYLTNSRYGGGVPLANINVDSLTTLDTWSNEQHFLILTDGSPVAGTRYTINGIVNTAQDCMVNLNLLADSADSWIQWDERLAQWGVLLNVAYDDIDPNTQISDLFSVTKDQILGGISLFPTDLKTSANNITIQYPNAILNNQSDYRYYTLPSQYTNPNEPINTLSINYPFVDNDLQATWLGYKKLWATREDLVINFTMDYSGIKIDAGDVIRVTHEWYGWTDRLFRVTQVKEAKDPSGFLSIAIAAMSYNESIYTTTNPGFFTLTEFNYNFLTDPNYITVPGKPTTTANTSTGKILVTSELPTSGRVDTMEFWYGNTSTIGVNNFSLYETQHYVTTGSNNSSVVSLYPQTGTESINVLNPPNGTYYFATKALGPGGSSVFSPVSDPVVWQYINLTGAIDGGTIIDGTLGGSKVITGNPATVGQANQSQPSFFDNLAPLAAISLGLLGGKFLLNEMGWLPADTIPKVTPPPTEDYIPEQLKNNVATTDIQYQDENGNPTDYPQEGGYQVINVASSPEYDEPSTYASFNDVGDYGGDYYG